MLKDESLFIHAIFANPIVTLFAILALGLALGKVKIKGLSLGASGVLFISLLFGHMGYNIPQGIGKIGLVLFVFCVGITAGPSFFAAFAKKGADLAKLSIITVLSGAITAYLCAKFANIRIDIAAGLFAGALTSTPGLASAMDALKENPTYVSIGYGIAYPFGVIGVVLFIQLLPKFLGIDLEQEAKKHIESQKEKEIVRILVKITNPDLFGKSLLSESSCLEKIQCCLSRIMINNKLQPVSNKSILEKDSVVLVVGELENINLAIKRLGEKIEREFIIDADNERMQIAVTSKNFLNKTLSEIQPLQEHGVTVSRITKYETTTIPSSSTKLEYGDLITVVGDTTNLNSFAEKAGNKQKVLQSTDIISLAVCITLGVILGKIPIPIPGIKPFTLGLAGGPLFVALIMGYFRKIFVFTARIPVASKVLLMELGLLFFLANAGIKAGGKIIPVLKEHGISLFIAGVAITIIPMIISYITATKLLKMNILEALGGICGGMTSTPALGALSSKVDSEIPVTSYATAYPVALILMTIAAQILVSVLS